MTGSVQGLRQKYMSMSLNGDIFGRKGSKGGMMGSLMLGGGE